MGIGHRLRAAVRHLGKALGSRRGRLTLLALLPMLIIVFVPIMAGWGDSLPNGNFKTGDRREASQLLADLSQDMSALAVAILVGVAIVLRDSAQLKRSRRFSTVAMVTALFAMTSIFSSIRFRFAIAEQMLMAELQFDAIANRLFVQMLALVVALSLLIALAASTYIPGPSRTPPGDAA